jgi:DNA-binding MarR family transcriptional regulator
MAVSETDGDWLDTLRYSITGVVRRKGPDLSARQLAIFLACYLEGSAQTVRGLARKLNISKPAVSRALDRLMQFDLVRRKDDPSDRRSILVRRTQTGVRFQRELGGIMQAASVKTGWVEAGSTIRSRTSSPARG